MKLGLLNNAFDRTAGSYPLAAAGQRGRSFGGWGDSPVIKRVSTILGIIPT